MAARAHQLNWRECWWLHPLLAQRCVLRALHPCQGVLAVRLHVARLRVLASRSLRPTISSPWCPPARARRCKPRLASNASTEVRQPVRGRAQRRRQGQRRASRRMHRQAARTWRPRIHGMAPSTRFSTTRRPSTLAPTTPRAGVRRPIRRRLSHRLRGPSPRPLQMTAGQPHERRHSESRWRDRHLALRHRPSGLRRTLPKSLGLLSWPHPGKRTRRVHQHEWVACLGMHRQSLESSPCF
mmetsp:Transcript_4281/g.8667  ORF Transcript_4281/g.8667 Transcript_4281/m.8667 type:complete len:240 (+) Transcript_4281:467-1186(+)